MCEHRTWDQVRAIVAAAVADLGADLGGLSAVDLCADNLEGCSTAEIRTALQHSGAARIVSPRVARGFSIEAGR